MQANAIRLSQFLLQKQPIRFFLISAFGAVLDLTVGALLLVVFQVSTYSASILGFSVGLIIAYIGHQKYTFGRRTTRLDIRRFGTFALSSLLVIGVRFCVIFLTEFLLSPSSVLEKTTSLILAIGISFFVNYILSKLVVFKN